LNTFHQLPRKAPDSCGAGPWAFFALGLSGLPGAIGNCRPPADFAEGLGAGDLADADPPDPGSGRLRKCRGPAAIALYCSTVSVPGAKKQPALGGSQRRWGRHWPGPRWLFRRIWGHPQAALFDHSESRRASVHPRLQRGNRSFWMCHLAGASASANGSDQWVRLSPLHADLNRPIAPRDMLDRPERAPTSGGSPHLLNTPQAIDAFRHGPVPMHGNAKQPLLASVSCSRRTGGAIEALRGIEAVAGSSKLPAAAAARREAWWVAVRQLGGPAAPTA